MAGLARMVESGTQLDVDTAPTLLKASVNGSAAFTTVWDLKEAIRMARKSWSETWGS